jgi:hypothetical protein
MSRNYGTGVSRVLDVDSRQFTNVIFQQGRPPLDGEFTMLADLTEDWRRIHVLRGCPSGVLSNVTNTEGDFITDNSWSNWFRLGQQKTGETKAVVWVCVNGWIIPVTGTGTGTPPGSPNDSDTWNKITLDPPPSNSGDSRIDFVFLEVWLAKVAPNPSTVNKPGASTLYRYGNVEGGYSYISDDIQDPALGFETTQRVQLQYRIRVVSGLIGLTSYPDGFDPAVVKAWGSAAADTSYTFENMRQELGDPGLWRAGDGTSNTLGTVDGYSYAVPICAVFRRNSVAWDGDPGQNLNGAFNRNPTATDRTGATTFSTAATLASALNDSDLSLSLVSATGIPLPLSPASAVTIKVDDEIMTYSVITGTTMTLTNRGFLDTKAENHLAGATVEVLAGRPDELFSDQIASTDILDLRHTVNPNGFDYNSMLHQGLDKLLRGEMRGNWKRSGGGPQGPFVFYQDKISASAAALGVTLLDAPDGHRTVYSDASMIQVMEFIAKAPPAQSTSEDVSVAWGLGLSGTADNSGGSTGLYNPGDTITIPVAQLKNSMPGVDSDQLQFLSGTGAVAIRIDGSDEFLVEGTDYSVTAVTGPSDDLTITLESGFPASVDKNLYITFHVLWGPGRGISRRPDLVHSVSYLSGNTNILLPQIGVPADNTPLPTSWAPLWSKYRDSVFNNLLPVTAPAYVDPGSKTVVLTPFRRVDLPDEFRTLDGSYVNWNTGSVAASGTDGITNGTTDFNSALANFGSGGDDIDTGDVIVISSGAAVGFYYVASRTDDNNLVLDRNAPAATSTYTIYRTQGLMPLDDTSGTSKWSITDPLELFSSRNDPAPATKNIYVQMPRKLIPGWGAVHVPIIHTDNTVWDEGINFLVFTEKGDKSAGPNSEKNFVPFSNGTFSYAAFSTVDLDSYPSSATYNTKYVSASLPYAGMRKYTDTRSLGREGLELPPFYGIARLFAVYEAQDYITNRSAYDPTSRALDTGGATNLLRQSFDGPVFWIEIDEDGDSTFILNAEVIDIAKSPNAIASFAAGDYVIEASIFGFDRGTFSLDSNPRLVLTRERLSGEADSGTRANNFGAGSSASVDTPNLVIPAPAFSSDEIAINYSRTPYQGDAWGSQTVQQDIQHKQGPLLTSTLYQLLSTELDEANLTRPNQKAVEVLASRSFLTTLGSGRLSGDLASSTYDFRNVGYENTSSPPTSALDPRPTLAIPALSSTYASAIGTAYHGCIERLPLGAGWRDKDFRGDFVSGASAQGQVSSPFVYTDSYGPGTLSSSIAVESSYEAAGLLIGTSSLSSGQPGEVVVQVDGEQGNYGLLVNYRTNRGGSGFTAFPPNPGGEFALAFPTAGPSPSYPKVLAGSAYLVRNTVTSIGSTEVSAGSELMLLVVTHGTQLDASSDQNLVIQCGTNGTGESYAAADLYRLPGHPLVSDNVRSHTDPASISLARKS